MNCEEAKQAWHTRLEDGQPNAELDRHRATCTACQAYATEMEGLASALAELRAETQDLRSVHAPTRQLFSRPGARLLRIAAAIVLVAGIYGVVRLMTTASLPQVADVGSQPPAKLPAAGDVGDEVEPLGITLHGESARTLLAVATPTGDPGVQMFRLYPTLRDAQESP